MFVPSGIFPSVWCCLVFFWFSPFSVESGSQYKHDFQIVRNKISQSMILIDKVFRLRANFKNFCSCCVNAAALFGQWENLYSKTCFVCIVLLLVRYFFAASLKSRSKLYRFGTENVSNSSNKQWRCSFLFSPSNFPEYLAFKLNLQLKIENAQNCIATGIENSAIVCLHITSVIIYFFCLLLLLGRGQVFN